MTTKVQSATSTSPISSREKKHIGLGTACFSIAGIVYLVSETVSAAAWHTPAYSYASNYISDLGVSGCGSLFHGRQICSPLYGVMNAGFMLEGLFFLMGAIICSRLIAQPWKAVSLLLALLHGVGMLMVGVFHGSQAALGDGSLRYHLLGAQMAIGAGNLALILYGSMASAIGLPPKLALPSVLLGCFGIVSAWALVAHIGHIPDGLTERGSVYTIMVWEIVVGVMVLWRRA